MSSSAGRSCSATAIQKQDSTADSQVNNQAVVPTVESPNRPQSSHPRDFSAIAASTQHFAVDQPTPSQDLSVIPTRTTLNMQQDANHLRAVGAFPAGQKPTSTALGAVCSSANPLTTHELPSPPEAPPGTPTHVLGVEHLREQRTESTDACTRA
ncbi:uncharacterized protein L3040_008132 [Drepanopeziza brunnea f. sp. 'multigermtubi']|uniref:uncharacterized protein n=1 Tax=Drepanopeziza brunnea f. sp. 'multigermtubi' TaxID=698441 RepID=UPI00238745C6|nr:hypothetical protein L3040_008132 [Drepanopeziza brunnea f. sp. 'multigermtubi']